MKTIRKNVFETNSSSTHAFTCSNDLRDMTEYPLPDENGVLRVNLTRFWTSDDYVNGDTCDSDDIKDIIEYICSHAVFSSVVWDSRTGKYEPHYDFFAKNICYCNRLFRDLYKFLKLPKIKSLYIYTECEDGSELEITDSVIHTLYTRQPFNDDLWNKEYFDKVHDKSKPALRRYIGLTPNDLSNTTMLSALQYMNYDYLGGNTNTKFAKLCEKEHAEDYYGGMIHSDFLYDEVLELMKFIFKYQSSMSFFHT